MRRYIKNGPLTGGLYEVQTWPLMNALSELVRFAAFAAREDKSEQPKRKQTVKNVDFRKQKNVT